MPLADGRAVAGAPEYGSPRYVENLQKDGRWSPITASPPAAEAAAGEGVAVPRILLAATLRWPVAARLALAFRVLGCHVEAICPAEHPVDRLRSASPSYRYRATRPLESLRLAIRASVPDLIVPCDDGASLHLNRLYEQLHAEGKAGGADALSIERSLGSPSACALAAARGEMAELAAREGLRVPDTRVVASVTELDAWISQHGFPAVLKIDNTWGGLGVRVVHNRGDAQRAFQAMAAGPSLAKTLIRTALDRDPSLLPLWLQHAPRTVTVQDFVWGIPANRAVACWKGRVLAGISVEALKTGSPTGPATVVSVIEHAEMSETAARLVRRLGLSGLWGFDFVLDTADRAAWLIEVNSRATPICHLALGDGTDLPAALCSQLNGLPMKPSGASIEASVIALFPGEWRRDPTSRILHAGYHDVPWGEPGLVDEGIGLSWEERGVLARLKRRLWPRHANEVGDDVAYAAGRRPSGPGLQR